MENSLVFVNFVCKNNDGTFDYDFYFSETPDIVWGVDWSIENPSSCIDLTPEKSTINEIKRATVSYKLKTIQETSCYSMEYSTFNIIALAWIDLDGLDEYPEKGRMVFHFGDSKEKVAELLSLYDFYMH